MHSSSPTLGNRVTGEGVAKILLPGYFPFFSLPGCDHFFFLFASCDDKLVRCFLLFACLLRWCACVAHSLMSNDQRFFVFLRTYIHDNGF